MAGGVSKDVCFLRNIEEGIRVGEVSETLKWEEARSASSFGGSSHAAQKLPAGPPYIPMSLREPSVSKSSGAPLSFIAEEVTSAKLSFTVPSTV